MRRNVGSTVPAKWDVKPKYVFYEGQTIEAFTRISLSLALNREVVTIRAMERKGILCSPRLVNKHGVRLYTRDQIEDLVTLAKKEGVLNPLLRKPFSDRFITEAHRILHRKPQLV